MSTHMIDRQRARRRLENLKAAIDREDPADDVHDPDVRELRELAGDEVAFEAGETVEIGRYLGCASEGHWESSFRQNPDFHVGTAEEVERWLADNYVEGWAGRWVIDLDDGTELSWTTLCGFDQDVERSVEPGYTVLAAYREDGQPYATDVYTWGGTEAAEEIAQRVCREDNEAGRGDDLLRIVGVIEGVHEVHGGDMDGDG
ncbi:MAG: hypothetical protein JSS68_01920 [Actinobacteria bacterium]|nr:hypothetical protein [Actinomycetota bacterium]